VIGDLQDDAASHQHAEAVRRLMRRQGALGLRVAAVFLAVLIGLPLFNQYYPKAATTPVAGYTLTWLLLGIAIFPVTWLLSAYFIRESDRIEAEASVAALGSTAALSMGNDAAAIDAAERPAE
jgi:uncharacterized membrane protein (DUF485 family)